MKKKNNILIYTMFTDLNNYFQFITVARASNYKVNKLGQVINKHGRLIKPHTGYNGYLGYNLVNNNGDRSFFSIHRLIGQHFIANPYNYPIIDHIDRNRTNNCISNLRWATYSMNSLNREKSYCNDIGKNIIDYKNRWRVQIRKDNNMLYDKSFSKKKYNIDGVKFERNQIYKKYDIPITD